MNPQIIADSPENFVERLELYGNRLAPYILTEKGTKQKKRLKIVFEVEKGIQIFPKMKG